MPKSTIMEHIKNLIVPHRHCLPNFFYPKIFLPKIFVGPKIIDGPKKKFQTKKFFEPKIYFGPKIFAVPKILAGPKNFSEAKFFSDHKFWQGHKFFQTQNFFQTWNFFQTQNFSDPKWTWLKNDLWSDKRNLRLSKLPSPKRLFKLEFDTEDQGLSFSSSSNLNLIIWSLVWVFVRLCPLVNRLAGVQPLPKDWGSSERNDFL